MAHARGCGSRVAGGQYLCTHLSAHGTPLPEFLIDPPIPIPAAMLASISPVGVHAFVKDGVTHVVNIVGQQFYPNVTDFYEEGKRLGFSTRAENIDMSQLTPASRIFHAHARAYLVNWQEFRDLPHWSCPKHLRGHQRETLEACPEGDLSARRECAPCFGLCYENLDPKTVHLFGDGLGGCLSTREMPSFTYTGCPTPEYITPVYKIAFFLSLPISGIEVVKDPNGGHSSKVQKLQRAMSLPWEVVSE